MFTGQLGTEASQLGHIVLGQVGDTSDSRWTYGLDDEPDFTYSIDD